MALEIKILRCPACGFRNWPLLATYYCAKCGFGKDDTAREPTMSEDVQTFPWWVNWRRWISEVIPWRFTTEFSAHTGVPWRVYWWQWHGWTFCKGGAPVGQRVPEWASSCECHDQNGVRIRPREVDAAEHKARRSSR